VLGIRSLVPQRSDSACMCRHSTAPGRLTPQSFCVRLASRQSAAQLCRPLPLWARPLVRLPLALFNRRLPVAAAISYYPTHADCCYGSRSTTSRPRHADLFRCPLASSSQTTGWQLSSTPQQSASCTAAVSQPGSPAKPRPEDAAEAAAANIMAEPGIRRTAADSSSLRRSASVRRDSRRQDSAAESPSQRQIVDRLLQGGPLRGEEALLRRATAQRLNFSMQVGSVVRPRSTCTGSSL